MFRKKFLEPLRRDCDLEEAKKQAKEAMETELY